MRGPIVARIRSLLPVAVVLFQFECTKLHFDTSRDDTSRAYGDSKDGEGCEVHVLLALAMTRGGLPLGNEVFPGNSRKGDGIIKTLHTMRPETARAVTVAGAGKHRQDNQDGPGAHAAGTGAKSERAAMSERRREKHRNSHETKREIRNDSIRNSTSTTMIQTHGPRRGGPCDLSHAMR